MHDYLNEGLKIYLEYGVLSAVSVAFNACLFVQVAMAVDQFIAVFRPFKHAQLRHKLNKWILTISILILTIQNTFRAINTEIVRQVNHVIHTAVVLVCLVTLVGAYTATYSAEAVRPAPRYPTRHTPN